MLVIISESNNPPSRRFRNSQFFYAISYVAVTMAVLAIFLHRENLKRLLKHQERKTDFFKKRGNAE